MGAIKAGVQLKPLDLTDQKAVKKVLDLLDKKPSESFTTLDIEMETRDMQDVIDKGMKKYKEEKAKGVVYDRLERNMYYDGPLKEPTK